LKKLPVNIIISRTDSIGDVVLTLPVAAVLKKYFPEIKIGFMGKAYTRPVIEACKNVDVFIDVNDFLNKKISVCGEKPEAILHVLPVSKIAFRAKQLNIPIRIGTSRRIYHWITCNKLVKLSRKNSLLHEAQLNIKLLKPLGITKEFSLKEIGESFALERLQPLPHRFSALIQKDKYNLILHPKSQGNGREWGLDNFIRLIHLLDKDRFQIFISGVQKERELLQPVFDAVGNEVTDIMNRAAQGEFDGICAMVAQRAFQIGLLQELARSIGGAIVNDDEFFLQSDRLLRHLLEELHHGLSFVVDRNDDGKSAELRNARFFSRHN